MIQPQSVSEITVASIPLAFVKALPVLKKAYNAKSRVPILSTIAVTYDGATLSGRVTDLEITASFRYTFAEPAVDATPFSIAIPFEQLERALKGAKEASIRVDSNDAAATVTTGEAQTVIPVFAAADFPPAPKIGDVLESVVLPQSRLYSMFRKVAPAASSEEARGAVLMGTAVDVGPAVPTSGGHGDGLTLTATDGYRLMQVFAEGTSVMVPPPDPKRPPRTAILPKSFVRLLCSIKAPKANAASDATLNIATAYAQMHALGFTVWSRLVDGTYPTYAAVFPGQIHNLPGFTVDRERIGASFKDGALLALGSSESVAIALDPDCSTATLTAKHQSGATFSRTLPIRTTHQETFTTAFNGMMVASVLNGFDGDEITIRQGDPSRPAVFTSTSNPGAIALQMPARR